MRLINNRKYIVGSFNGKSNEACILDYEDPVLRIRNDSCLILRYLNNCETIIFDDGVGN